MNTTLMNAGQIPWRLESQCAIDNSRLDVLIQMIHVKDLDQTDEKDLYVRRYQSKKQDLGAFLIRKRAHPNLIRNPDLSVCASFKAQSKTIYRKKVNCLDQYSRRNITQSPVKTHRRNKTVQAAQSDKKLITQTLFKSKSKEGQTTIQKKNLKGLYTQPSFSINPQQTIDNCGFYGKSIRSMIKFQRSKNIESKKHMIKNVSRKMKKAIKLKQIFSITN